jgi:formylglycine-generating enzyme required for sulfatase activity
MARIEKTVFISYRRADVYTALAVYENLKNQGYDVFFDYRSISSGDFEQIITSNIRARAHFLLILTPTALDRCNEPGDWLRREIEIAIGEKRNIIPLFFKGFRFGIPSVSDKLTGRLSNLNRYNGLNVHEDYFDEAMQRVRTQYLNIPLNTVLHPVSTEVQKVVIAEQFAADEALEQIDDVKELVKQADEKPPLKKDLPKPLFPQALKSKATSRISTLPWRMLALVGAGVLIIGFLIWGVAKFSHDSPQATSEPTGIFQPSLTSVIQPTTTASHEPEQTNTPPASETSIPIVPTLGIGSTLAGKDGMTLLYVPAGEFTMGGYGESDTEPGHTVFLDAFWMDRTEVTNAMYAQCVDDGACNKPSSTKSSTRASYYGNSEFKNYPVIYVSWHDANAYCKWSNRRLPSEAEWEKSARGKNGRRYPWGNDKPSRSLLSYYQSDTTEAGIHPDGASPYGVLDMAGNVREWTADWYDATYYAISPASNPLGPNTAAWRVLRGSSWNDGAEYCAGVYCFDAIASTRRVRGGDYQNSINIGFRCAMSATP